MWQDKFSNLDSRPSSRMIKPPGGGSSIVLGESEDEPASRRPNKMASTVFAPPEEPQGSLKRSNPPGGKSTVIFGEPAPVEHRPVPPTGSISNVFGAGEACSSVVKAPHPNKPKDNIGVSATVNEAPVQVAKEEAPAPQASPRMEEPSPATSGAELLENHEPRLGPRPRSHNRVLNPPGGKSSVVFY